MDELDRAVAVIAEFAGMPKEEVKPIVERAREASAESREAYEFLKGIFRLAARNATGEDFRRVMDAWYIIL